MFFRENLDTSHLCLNFNQILFFLAAAKEAQFQQKEWWELISGVLAIPAALLGIVLAYYGLVKLKDEIRKIRLEIHQKEIELETQKQQIEVNTELIKRLAAIEQAVNNSQEKDRVFTTIIDDYELKHLQRLASSESYLKYEKRESFFQELRRLRTLGFIESHPNKYIGSMPNGGNLRDYVKITERGRAYLDIISNRMQSKNKV